MDLGIRGIGELVRVIGSRRRLDLLGLLDRGEHPALGIRQDQLGPERGQGELPLVAHLRRKREDQSIPPRGRDLGEPDSRVA